MLRQATLQKTIMMLSTISLILIFVVFSSCYKYVTPPGSGLDSALDQTFGSIGDDNITTSIELFNDTNSGDWYTMSEFQDKNSGPIGTAKLVADREVVSAISKQKFNIPGNTKFQLGNNIDVRVSVTESSETKYNVAVYDENALGMPPVSFVIDNLSALGKVTTNTSIEQAKLVDQTMFAGYLATHIILLFRGPLNVIEEIRACYTEAQEYCDPLGVQDYYFEITFSFSEGFRTNCQYTCRPHDQGRWGFY